MRQQPGLAFANNRPIGCQLASVPPTPASRRSSERNQTHSCEIIKGGKLDAKELAQSVLRVSRLANVGK
jgi:hypothetical protein